MKITVINGNTRHGSTWHCMDTLRQALMQYDDVETKEFFLPRDMPHFCMGCFSCFYNGEQTCPHASAVQPIVQAMVDADLILLTSPVYSMDIAGQLKAFLDHLSYMWMSHRPNPHMFNKVGVTIVTTAGAGLGHTTKTMRNSLKFWGAKRIFSYKKPVSAMKWSDVSEKKQKLIKMEMDSLAKKISKAVQHVKKLRNPLFRSFFFKIMTGMMKKNTWNPRDRKHWEENGWLTGSKPF
ncbi:MAG: flavodoxin family protein [Christensenellales bacterium]